MSKLLAMGEKEIIDLTLTVCFVCVCVCVQFSFIFLHICKVLHEYSLK